jgi:hypothetical protein
VGGVPDATEDDMTETAPELATVLGRARDFLGAGPATSTGELLLRDLVEAVDGGVALAPDDDLEYMVCVGGACMRPEDDDLPLPEAWARVRELVAAEDGGEYDPQPVQLIVYSKAALRRVAGRVPQ